MTPEHTDGHWPIFDRVAALIICECGERPGNRSQRVSMRHVWHQSHRRRLALRPVEYVWGDDDLRSVTAFSSGGYVQVKGHEWKEGKWIPCA